MKMKNKISVFVAAILIVGAVSVSCERELDRPPISEVDSAKVLTIADLYKIQADSGNDYVFVDDYMLYGTIVMDDSTGNIYKEAYLQDSTGGINLFKLSSAGELNVGQYVRINLKKVKILEFRGKLELSFVDILDFGKSLIIQKSNVPIAPMEITLDEFYSGEYLCELVTLKDVQVVPADTAKTWANKIGTSGANILLQACDNPAKTITVRTNDRSKFAGEKVPKGKGNITGIATKFQYPDGPITWQILIRDVDEVDLTGPRCGETK